VGPETRRGLFRRSLVHPERQLQADGQDFRKTPLGRETMHRAAPGHVSLVRELVIDALTPEQLDSLAEGLAAVQRRIVERKM
jgi:hypothetical protein